MNEWTSNDQLLCFSGLSMGLVGKSVFKVTYLMSNKTLNLNQPISRCVVTTVQPGVWWRQADETGVVPDDSCHSRCTHRHPTWFAVWHWLTAGRRADLWRWVMHWCRVDDFSVVWGKSSNHSWQKHVICLLRKLFFVCRLEFYFYRRNAMLARYQLCLSVCLSVCLLQTHIVSIVWNVWTDCTRFHLQAFIGLSYTVL